MHLTMLLYIVVAEEEYAIWISFWFSHNVYKKAVEPSTLGDSWEKYFCYYQVVIGTSFCTSVHSYM